MKLENFATPGLMDAFQNIAYKLGNFTALASKIPTNLVRDANQAHPRLIVVQCFLAETLIFLL